MSEYRIAAARAVTHRLTRRVALTGATPIARHPFEARVCAFAR